MKETDLPELQLEFLSIRGEEVKDLKKSEMNVSVFANANEEIEAEDIVAKFTYGSVTQPEKIRAWMKDGTKILPKLSIEDDGTDVTLSVPAQKGKYKSWKGKVKIKKRIPVMFRFNGSAKYIRAMAEKADGSFFVVEPEVVSIEGSSLKFHISNEKEELKTITLNGEDISTQLSEYESGSKLNKLIALKNVQDGDEINLVVQAKDEKFAESRFNFKVRGSTQAVQESISAKLYIAGNGELPKKSFLEKLTDDTNPPTWKVKDDKAKVLIVMDEYTRDFLVESVSIDGENVEIQAEPNWSSVEYKAEKSIAGLSASPKLILIVFKSKNESASPSVTWKFNLVTGGDLNPLSRTAVQIFTINSDGKKGLGENTFKPEFWDSLNDGSKPLYTFAGGANGEVELKLGNFGDSKGKYKVAEVKYSIDGTMHTATVKEESQGFLKTKYFTIKTNLQDEAEHEVHMEIVPVENAKYSSLTWDFKLKNTKEKPLIPEVNFFVDRGLPKSSPYTEKDAIKGELCELSVNAWQDNIAKLEIGAEGDLKECPLVAINTQDKGTVYVTEKYVTLSTDGSYKKYIIRAYPKETDKYRITDFVCFLKGTKVGADNARFYHHDDKPYIFHENAINYKGEAGSVREYGVASVDLHIKTFSPRAKVQYRFVGLNGETLTMKGDGEPKVKEMQNDGAGGNVAKIEFFSDKPTKVEAWVVSENGERDDAFGKWSKTYSYVPVKFATEEPSDVAGLKEFAYDEIVVDKSNLSGNKLYIGFAISKEKRLEKYEYSFSSTYQYPSYQTKPEKLEDIDDYTWYRTDIDVSSLTESNPLEVAIPITTKGESCFLYKLKITM